MDINKMTPEQTTAKLLEVIQFLLAYSNRYDTSELSDTIAKAILYKNGEHPTVTSALFQAIKKGFVAMQENYREEIPQHTDDRLKTLFRDLDRMQSNSLKTCPCGIEKLAFEMVRSTRRMKGNEETFYCSNKCVVDHFVRKWI